MEIASLSVWGSGIVCVYFSHSRPHLWDFNRVCCCYSHKHVMDCLRSEALFLYVPFHKIKWREMFIWAFLCICWPPFVKVFLILIFLLSLSVYLYCSCHVAIASFLSFFELRFHQKQPLSYTFTSLDFTCGITLSLL